MYNKVVKEETNNKHPNVVTNEIISLYTAGDRKLLAVKLIFISFFGRETTLMRKLV